MAQLEPLVRTDQLKRDFLAGKKTRDLAVELGYDDSFDAFMVKFMPNAGHVVHYLQGDFAALVEPDSLEIIGFWIENFKSKFLARHPEQEGIWTVFGDVDNTTRLDVLLGLLAVALNDAHNDLSEPQSRAKLVNELEAVFT